MIPIFQCGRYALTLDRPRVMAIINVTPDSFSGGSSTDHAATIARAREAIAAGADFLDIGGESTRPGSEPVSEAQELWRVIPVVEALAGCGVPLSVDTMKPAVMRAALAAGADLINDIRAFQVPGAIEAIVESNCGLCLMHMQGLPRSMQQAPHYTDVVGEVEAFLVARMAALREAGVAPGRILIDPGFGFGKNLNHNVTLFQALPHLAKLAPVLAGVSRKSMLGELTGLPVDQRVTASVVAALAALRHGAAIIRVHDVPETVAALRVWRALAPTNETWQLSLPQQQ